MRFVTIGILVVVAVVCGGCGKVKPTQAKAALDKMLRKTKPAPNTVIPPLHSVHPPRVSTNPLLPPGSVSTTVSAQISHSKSVGNRLLVLKPRIPLPVYDKLWNEWQANDRGLEESLAQIRSLESQCTAGGEERMFQTGNELVRVRGEWRIAQPIGEASMPEWKPVPGPVDI